MSDGLYHCVNCQLRFGQEHEYKLHYKSEHHRYNVKRRLISLPPLGYEQYLVQFQNDMSSKSSSQREAYCDICSKKFMSLATYKQHINSHRHKNNRKLLADAGKLNASLSQSSFEDIDKTLGKYCHFCLFKYSEEHLASAHSFPPFRDQCIDIDGLLGRVNEIISAGRCIYCGLFFESEGSARQHMIDVGHGKINLENFGEFEQYYFWRIEEEDEAEGSQNDAHCVTFEKLEERRQDRILLTNIGAVVNGREIGCRMFKKYYKQYLGSQLPETPAQHLAITNGEGDQWRVAKHHFMRQPKSCKLVHSTNHR